jgi:hypothetical protein
MAPHGLTFGENCGDLEKILKNVEPPEMQIYSENQHNVFIRKYLFDSPSSGRTTSIENCQRQFS